MEQLAKTWACCVFKLLDAGGMPTLDCPKLDHTQLLHNVTRTDHWPFGPLDRQGRLDSRCIFD
jgi:hypothetical protein